jgi:hypothetical protein
MGRRYLFFDSKTCFAIEDSLLSQRAKARFGRSEGSPGLPKGVFEAAELLQKPILGFLMEFV